MRRTPLRRTVHRVTDYERQVYAYVMARDKGCVAPQLDPTVDACAGYLTRQHVRLHPGSRRVTQPNTVLILCHHHHLDGWATSHDAMVLQRAHLAAEPEVLP